jgi:hypothetical protein
VISNIGNVINKGIELNLNTEIISNNNVEWIFGINGSLNKNEVTKVTAATNPNYFIQWGGLGCSTCGFIQAMKPGSPKQTYIVYEQVYGSDGKPLQDVYIDQNKDGIINQDDRRPYKNPNPTVLLGVNSRLNYKSWDFAFSGRASFGNYVYNGIAAGSTYTAIYGVGSTMNITKQVQKSNFDRATLEQFSDLFIEKASFFRMDNINFGYTFANVYRDKLKIRVGTGVQNVFVITKYSGIDPEISGGIDNNFFPRTRSFFLNVNCQF